MRWLIKLLIEHIQGMLTAISNSRGSDQTVQFAHIIMLGIKRHFL